ncbi:MAG: type II toxin-antitoxin system RelE/ParE family toxin [Dehalococcoidia bacterium]
MVRGSRFVVYALVEGDGACPFEEFLAGLDIGPRRSLVQRIVTHANVGPLRNEQQSRRLSSEIWEFKVPAGPGYRVAYFYAGARRTILTHGWRKVHDPRREIAKAEAMRSQWLLANEEEA